VTRLLANILNLIFFAGRAQQTMHLTLAEAVTAVATTTATLTTRPPSRTF